MMTSTTARRTLVAGLVSYRRRPVPAADCTTVPYVPVDHASFAVLALVHHRRLGRYRGRRPLASWPALCWRRGRRDRACHPKARMPRARPFQSVPSWNRHRARAESPADLRSSLSSGNNVGRSSAWCSQRPTKIPLTAGPPGCSGEYMTTFDLPLASALASRPNSRPSRARASSPPDFPTSAPALHAAQRARAVAGRVGAEVANRLEAACWDDAASDPRLPRSRGPRMDQSTASAGSLSTMSIHEAHRLNSAYINRAHSHFALEDRDRLADESRWIELKLIRGARYGPSWVPAPWRIPRKIKAAGSPRLSLAPFRASSKRRAWSG